ncbi:transcription factor HHO2-like [Juglans microcarpa x Juglans regia]|uniref:transcription factor HHO2-like n=1 Tax=Juglans microcarpa x Juglans regia TaxID=2249226 RepID=UPI001B7EA161|nr:transcription factor HHO2-like [Juglans microcarpa x Juglans regia]
MDYYPEKMQHRGGLGFREYVKALEEERRKIQVFQRELPLCLELVTQAIEACRQQYSGTTTENNLHGQSESSEQTTSNDVPPVFEEFFPIKRSASSDDEVEEHQSHKNKKEKVISNDNKKKSDWLRSVQLWNNPTSDPQPKEDVPRKATVMEVKRNGGGGGAFQPFQREKSAAVSNASEGKAPSSLAPEPEPVAAVATTSSSAETATGGGGENDRREQKEGQAQRKQRRNWSPELHRRFLHALQQLGGSQAATPKQIRELMKVDGLTNDEVKSHLQKYRLHTRRPSPSIHNNGNQQPPQVVVVGGIWMPAPAEYAAVAASGDIACSVAAANGIYAPVAAPPPAVQQASTSQIQRLPLKQSQPPQSEERVSHSGKRACSDSPATSSSTHTTTTFPVF